MFDAAYRLRDVYSPNIGKENHTTRHTCRFGVFVDGRLTRVDLSLREVTVQDWRVTGFGFSGPACGSEAVPGRAPAVNSATTGLWSLRPAQRDPVTTRQDARRTPQAEGTKMPSQW
jgi:hypothetical protein